MDEPAHAADDLAPSGSPDQHAAEEPPIELAQAEASIAPEQAPPGPDEPHAEASEGGDADVSESALFSLWYGGRR